MLPVKQESGNLHTHIKLYNEQDICKDIPEFNWSCVKCDKTGTDKNESFIYKLDDLLNKKED